jgi:hypothetical protein
MISRGDVPLHGEGFVRVRSCGLVRKHDGTRMAVKERYPEEGEIGARFIIVFPSRCSRREQHSHASQRTYGGLRFRVNKDLAVLGRASTRY